MTARVKWLKKGNSSALQTKPSDNLMTRFHTFNAVDHNTLSSLFILL